MKNLLSLAIVSFLFISSFFLSISCEKNPTEPQFPDCMRAKVDSIIARPVNFKPAELWLWRINGVRYYYLTSPCCNNYDYLYDSDCNIYCAPTGGTNNQGDGTCNLQGKKIKRVLLWKDAR